MAKQYKCATCPRRKNYDLHPESVSGKLWHAHIKVCPYWRAYTNSLSNEEFAEVQKQYGLKDRKNK